MSYVRKSLLTNMTFNIDVCGKTGNIYQLHVICVCGPCIYLWDLFMMGRFIIVIE